MFYLEIDYICIEILILSIECTEEYMKQNRKENQIFIGNEWLNSKYD